MVARSLLPLSYVALALGVYQNFGFYTPLALVLVALSFLGVLAAACHALKGHRDHAPPPALLASSLLIFLTLGALKLPGMYLRSQTYAVLFFYTSLLLIPTVIFFYFIPRKWKGHWRPVVFGTAVFVALAFRGAMPMASPAPDIDVFAITQESAQHLLDRLNPYTTPIASIGQEQERFGYHFTYYHYPPASLYLLTMGYLLFGDVRYTYVVCEIVIAFVLWSLARRGMPRPSAELLVLLFLYHPRSLFVLEQAWTEPLILLFFSLFLLCAVQRRSGSAAILHGYLLSLKQYLIYFALHWLMVERRLRYLALGFAVILLTIAPFLLVNGPGFGNAIVSPFLQAGFRSDSLSVSSALYRYFGIRVGALSGSLFAMPVAIATAFSFRKLPALRGYLFAVTLTTFSMFFLGNLAFANYYYFVGGLLLFLIATPSGEEGGTPLHAPRKKAQTGPSLFRATTNSSLPLSTQFLKRNCTL